MTDLFYKLPQDIAARNDIKASAKIIYAVIVDYRGNPGKRMLMQKTGMTSQAVCDAIKRLEAAGVLEVLRRGNGKRNEYKSGRENRPVGKTDRKRSGKQTGSGRGNRPQPD